MIQINYPEKKPSIKREENREVIFCMVRKKWLVLTAEEWVRQNFLLYLTETLNFPLALIAVEKQIVLSEVKKRFDIVVYDKDTKPYILIECKEMDVKLSSSTLHQALNYNSKIQSRYLIITNGNHTIGFEKRGDEFVEIDEVKKY